ncbi:hypothetical protein BsWGS_15911 [Bradybaena similaris]
MTAHVGLTVALVVALFSNAVLLFTLILQSSNLAILKCQLQTRLDINDSSENHFSDYIYGQVNPDLANLRDRISETQDGQRNADLFLRWKNIEKRTNVQDLLMLGKRQSKENANNGTFSSSTVVNSSRKDSDADDDDVDGSDVNFVDSDESRSTNSQTPRQLLSLKRHRRGADAPVNKTSTVGGPTSHRLHEIFSTFSDSELAKFDGAVYDLLVPALVHFETMTIRELESLHSIVISMDLRLEGLENSMLNIARWRGMEPQADPVDNTSELDSPSHILDKKEGFLPATNDTQIFEVHLDIDGSGEVDGESAPTTRPPHTTTMPNVAFYDLYRILSTLEQKVMALENYNVMSDSELTRVRSEVVKMDDKVTELDRRQRNLQIRTSMHTQKITELEVYMSKSEMGIHTALDSYGRVNSRLEAFKDKLTEFKNDLQAVTGQFGRHDQIATELRAADSYKAHDIQEIRKSVFSIEGRLNGLYRVLDLNLDTVRSDLRAMLDRLCANNKLAC